MTKKSNITKIFCAVSFVLVISFSSCGRAAKMGKEAAKETCECVSEALMNILANPHGVLDCKQKIEEKYKRFSDRRRFKNAFELEMNKCRFF